MPDYRTAEQLQRIAQQHREAAEQQTGRQAVVSLRLAEWYETLSAMRVGTDIYHGRRGIRHGPSPTVKP